MDEKGMDSTYIDIKANNSSKINKDILFKGSLVVGYVIVGPGGVLFCETFCHLEYLYTPKLTWTTTMEVWLTWFSFTNEWFLGSATPFFTTIWEMLKKNNYLFQASNSRTSKFCYEQKEIYYISGLHNPPAKQMLWQDPSDWIQPNWSGKPIFLRAHKTCILGPWVPWGVVPFSWLWVPRAIRYCWCIKSL